MKLTDRHARALVFAWGALLQVVHLALARGFFGDEASLALNVLGRDYRGLLAELDGYQVAPPLFLWGLETATRVLGHGDWVYRLLPFAAAVIACGLVFPVLRRLGFSGPVAVVAGVLTVSSPLLLRYGTEVKQYSGDLAAVLALYYALLRLRGWPRALVLALGGGIGLFYSNVLLIVMVPVGAWLLLEWWRGPQRGAVSLLSVVFVGAVWSLAFGMYYIGFVSEHGSGDYFRGFWQYAFLPTEILSSDPYVWLSHRLGVVSYKVWFAGWYEAPRLRYLLLPLPYLTLGASLVGLTEWVRQRALRWLVLVVGPFFVHLALSSLELYPFGTRLCTYLLPLAAVLAVSGLATLANSRRRWVGAVGRGIGGVLAVAFAGGVALSFPFRGDGGREALAYVDARRTPDEPVAVVGNLTAVLEFYQRTSGVLTGEHVTADLESGNALDQVPRRVERLAPRSWMVFASVNIMSPRSAALEVSPALFSRGVNTYDDRDYVMDAVRAAGAVVTDSIVLEDAYAYKVERHGDE